MNEVFAISSIATPIRWASEQVILWAVDQNLLSMHARPGYARLGAWFVIHSGLPEFATDWKGMMQ